MPNSNQKMSKLIKYAEYFMMAEFMKAKQEVFQNESGREGVDFISKPNQEISMNYICKLSM